MTEPHKPTKKPEKAPKRELLRQWLAARPGLEISEAEFAEIYAALAPVSHNYLRKLLRDSGAPLAPIIAGVRQGNFDELEASLLALLDEYERGDHARQSAIRKLVITAKDHARWATSRAGSASNKQEMILWMVTWLENPPVFKQWVKIRRSLNSPKEIT